MFEMPTFKQLRYLIALEEHLHFGNAATACSISQSTFSTAIKDLESTLNVTLVDRTNRSVVFTPVGGQIVTEARSVIAGLDNVVKLANATQRPLSGQLRLGTIPTVAPFILPKLVPAIRRKFPTLELHLSEEKASVIHRMLIDGDLDLLLLALPCNLPGTDTLAIFEDPFAVAYHQNTKLLDQNNITHSSVRDHSILLLEEKHCMRAQAMDACSLATPEKISTFTASDIHSLVQMVTNDLGITYIPQIAIDSGVLKNTPIKTKQLADNCSRTIGLAWRKGSEREAEFTLMAEVIRESAPQTK